MDPQAEEVQDFLFKGNYQGAHRIARKWLDDFPFNKKDSDEYKKAEEAYLYSRYLSSRQERVNSMTPGKQIARAYLEFLHGMEALRKEHKLDLNGDPHFWDAVSKMIHAKIAEGFAKAFAGQKSYNLNDSEVVQLGISLLHLEKWSSALEALAFLHRYNKVNPEVNLLMSYAYYQLNQEEEFLQHFRDVLFYRPEILADYMQFVPAEFIKKFNNDLDVNKATSKKQFIKYALLLEINGFFKSQKVLNNAELKKIQSDFQSEYDQFKKNKEALKDQIPHLLLQLCWIISAYKQKDDYDKVELFREKMISLSSDTWDTFYQKSL